MAKYQPKIGKEKKQPKKPNMFLVIAMWILWILIFVLDMYKIIFSTSGINSSDLFCDFGILVIAVYLTAMRFKK